jgi:hypothetical protein
MKTDPPKEKKKVIEFCQKIDVETATPIGVKQIWSLVGARINPSFNSSWSPPLVLFFSSKPVLEESYSHDILIYRTVITSEPAIQFIPSQLYWSSVD